MLRQSIWVYNRSVCGCQYCYWKLECLLLLVVTHFFFAALDWNSIPTKYHVQFQLPYIPYKYTKKKYKKKINERKEWLRPIQLYWHMGAGKHATQLLILCFNTRRSAQYKKCGNFKPSIVSVHRYWHLYITANS